MNSSCHTGASPLLTIRQAADLLSISERTMRRIIQRGEVPTVRMLGRVIRVRPADLDAFLSARADPSRETQDA